MNTATPIVGDDVKSRSSRLQKPRQKTPTPFSQMLRSSHLCVLCAFFLCALCVTLFPSFAHDGPEHDIEELTERIEKEGASADLLLQRAVEYQVIKNTAAAIKDLEQAQQLDPGAPAILRELGRAYFANGKTNEALSTVTRGLSTDVQGPERASLLMVRSEILRPRKEYEKALADANEAIKEHPSNVEWYLDRSQLHAILNKTKERVAGIEQGIQQTGSGLLQIELVDALIDDGQHEIALEKIEAELAASRLQSSWLIRRAKVRLAQKQNDAAKTDLEAALKELNSRLSGTNHDSSLLADRGLVHELLGDTDSAHKDYTRARDRGLSDEWIQERIRATKK
jgi:tetratricopeptide (TPR) repeat protein